MSFRRYIASTAREALERVRRELGEDAVILSNKRLGPGRVEIVAAASDSMQALVQEADRPQAPARQAAVGRERGHPDARAPAAETFHDFIRRQPPAAAPRMREDAAGASPRARPPSRSEAVSARAGVAMYHEVARAHREPDMAPARQAGSAQAPSAPAVFRQRATRETDSTRAAPLRPAVQAETPASATIAGSASPAPFSPPAPEPPEIAAVLEPTPAPKPVPTTAKPRQEAPEAAAAMPPQTPSLPAPVRDDTQVMAELRSLRAALSDRIAALESNIASSRPPAAADSGAQRNTATTRVMTRLLMSGFSPDLARRIAGHAPATSDIAATDTWLHEVIAGNLRCASALDGLMEGQGAIALVGPTGVGKTTTVAKLAARFAVRYGAAQLGLVTLDSYRIGAHEQLRSYGRILGVPMHIAQDGATLRELLASLQGKRLVLIDTCGLSQRDERMEEMLGTLSSARFGMRPIRRVLLLNAASHSETLDEVARAWHAQDAAGAILTKLDEAARIGGAIDCMLRYRLTLFGLTNGQRVPEDWHPAGARLIAHVALKPSTSPFTLGDEEAQAWSEQPPGGVHA
jgi:flagellar biosynthesis protein FlhF